MLLQVRTPARRHLFDLQITKQWMHVTLNDVMHETLPNIRDAGKKDWLHITLVVTTLVVGTCPQSCFRNCIMNNRPGHASDIIIKCTPSDLIALWCLQQLLQ